MCLDNCHSANSTATAADPHRSRGRGARMSREQTCRTIIAELHNAGGQLGGAGLGSLGGQLRNRPRISPPHGCAALGACSRQQCLPAPHHHWVLPAHSGNAAVMQSRRASFDPSSLASQKTSGCMIKKDPAGRQHDEACSHTLRTAGPLWSQLRAMRQVQCMSIRSLISAC